MLDGTAGVIALNSRRILSASVVLLVIIGLGFVSIPFVRSFEFPGGSGDQFPRIDLRELEPGSYLVVSALKQPGVAPDVLVIRDFDGQVRAFKLLAMNGMYMMPDLGWDRWGGECRDFGPDGVEGRLAEFGVIRCQDSDLRENQSEEWRWAYSGEKLGQWTADLLPMEIAQEGNFIRLGR